MDSPVTLVPAFFSPGGTQWIIILFVALLLFGRRLPEIMKGLGGSIREFKKGMDTDASKSDSAPDGAVSRQAEPPPAPPVTHSAPPVAHSEQRASAPVEPPKSP